MFKDIETLREQIRAFGLNRLEDKIVSLAKPAIFMHRTAAAQDELANGESRLGGLPDLPANFQWPYFHDKPLTFIAQFKMSQVAAHDTENILPKQGILYCFYDGVASGELEERDAWQVFYLENETTPLIRTPCPKYQNGLQIMGPLPVHRINYESVLSIPVIFYSESEDADFDIHFENLPGQPSEQNFDHHTEDSPYIKMLRDHPSEHTAYFNLLKAPENEARHYWFGHPHRIQEDVEWDVVTMSRHIQPEGDPAKGEYGYTDKQIAQIEAEMKKWQFLFQIDSADGLNVMWGIAGTLYVCVPKTSLAERRFEDCWTIMQCS